MIKIFAPNIEGRDFVIGDLHGCYSILENALYNINFDTKVDRLFSVGDIIDRGPQNELCLTLLNEPWFHSVKGNHEQMLFDYFFTNDHQIKLYYPQRGGAWAVIYDYNFIQHNSEFLLKVTRNAAKINNLPYLITVNQKDGSKFHIIHAELSGKEIITDDDLINEEEFKKISLIKSCDDGEAILWGRFIFGKLYNKQLDKNSIEKFKIHLKNSKLNQIYNENISNIYCGHTIMKKPVKFKCLINLDTMAYGSYFVDAPKWASLTITEPSTNKFWKVTEKSFEETSPIII